MTSFQKHISEDIVLKETLIKNAVMLSDSSLKIWPQTWFPFPHGEKWKF